jgi:hypothetical protein
MEPMSKAYDFNNLKDRLAKHGASLSEEAAEKVALELFMWIEESATISENAWDNMAMILMPQLKEIVFKQLDKIDGDANS